MSLRDKMLPNMKYSNAAENFEIDRQRKSKRDCISIKTFKNGPSWELREGEEVVTII